MEAPSESEAPISAQKVVVVIGAGGIGIAIARRLGNGKQLLISNSSGRGLNAALNTLREEGYLVQGRQIDVSSESAVIELVETALSLGSIETVVHAAGVSPARATAKQILSVDLLGTAFVIGAFFAAIEAGGSLICISSMSGHMGTLSPELERHLALAPVEKLLEHAEIDPDLLDGMAYMIAKRGNILHVQAAASSWGSKGARINSISPGLIISRMGNAELEGPTGDFIRPLTKVSGARRFGTAADIANTALFLSGPDSSFITGNDFLVDGGVTSAFRWNF